MKLLIFISFLLIGNSYAQVPSKVIINVNEIQDISLNELKNSYSNMQVFLLKFTKDVTASGNLGIPFVKSENKATLGNKECSIYFNRTDFMANYRFHKDMKIYGSMIVQNIEDIFSQIVSDRYLIIDTIRFSLIKEHEQLRKKLISIYYHHHNLSHQQASADISKILDEATTIKSIEYTLNGTNIQEKKMLHAALMSYLHDQNNQNDQIETEESIIIFKSDNYDSSYLLYCSDNVKTIYDIDSAINGDAQLLLQTANPHYFKTP